MQERQKHRLKQKELVMSIFSLFSTEFEESNVSSIWDITLPIEKIITYLNEKHNVLYKNAMWVYTQLRRYENELGVRLFQKIQKEGSESNFSLKIYQPFIYFFQKQHLYLSQKIKISNGAWDLIKNTMGRTGFEEPLKILLGAGSTIYHLAIILAKRSKEENIRFKIYTHNLGSLKQLVEPKTSFKNITVYTPAGKIDPVTYTIVGEDNEIYLKNKFDFIIQGTSCIHKGNLYIESAEEKNRKQTMLKECEGTKLLLLTKHELSDSPLKNRSPYGRVEDYDYVILPKGNTNPGVQKRYDNFLKQFDKILEAEILSWNYLIFKIKHQPDEV